MRKRIFNSGSLQKMVAIVNRLQGEASLKRYYLKKDVKEKKR